MSKELKIRLADRAATEAAIRARGAEYIGAGHAVHTYFNQPAGHVLKTVRSGDGLWLLQLERQGTGFVVTAREDIASNDPRITDYAHEFGISAVLDMHTQAFKWGQFNLETFDIAGVGQFLVQTAEHPDPQVFTKIGISKPEYITVPFNELPRAA